MQSNTDIKAIYNQARKRLLRMYFEAGSGHIGGSLSCLEALLALYHRVMEPEDQFVLSKGHAAGAWYVSLWSRGLLSSEELETFSRDGGLPGHPPAIFPECYFPPGPLGTVYPWPPAWPWPPGNSIQTAAFTVCVLTASGRRAQTGSRLSSWSSTNSR